MGSSMENSKVLSYLSKYQNKDRTRKDIMQALQAYHGLACSGGLYTFRDFTKKDLVCLEGTIPITYKTFDNGMQKSLVSMIGTIPVYILDVCYHFPICIWLMDTHPKHAPIVYVKPTENMVIKPSMYVDFNGKVYLPYLHEWNAATSDIVSLIQVMCAAFGEVPPLYTKPKDKQNSSPYPVQPKGYMPMPGGSGGAPMPPYPTTGAAPYPVQSESQQSSFYPPYPTQPMSGYNMPPYPPTSSYSATPYPVQQPTPYPPQPQPSYPATTQPSNTGTITEEHVRASLLTAVEDKLRRKLKDVVQQSQAELEILQQSQTELKQGEAKLNQILAKLEKDKLELDRSMVMIKEKELELEKVISRLAEQDSLDVDEAVIPTAPLYKQILNAFAEEASTEDAIYYMGEALRHGVIDLDVFLKQVRSLSRKQFMFRALIQKCRQKAGLAG
ncbi:tumor susceptibility gene 101 protein isoform X2 [Bemisia tabaci]|uniref:tumor susceptibility gene 101 protein isoform X2 n=1 Tax=Bemisia tabaci TaxID=7038 RepID=UPI003B27B59D